MPEGYEEACFDEKAIIRERRIGNPRDLPRLALLYLLYLTRGHSLLEMSMLAFTQGITISHTGLMKKFAPAWTGLSG